MSGGFPDHPEQAIFFAYTVNDPGRIENLVPAMLGVGLGKHHQFDICRRLSQTQIVLDQVTDLVLGQGQSHLLVDV